jgi:transcription-repair coupling factor (superfamily II helicase)
VLCICTPEPALTTTRLAELAGRLGERRGPVRIQGLRGGARAAVIARLVEAHAAAPALVLTAGAKETDRLVDDLRAALGEGPAGRVRPYPHPDAGPYDRFSPQPLVIAQRMEVLHRLATPGADDAPPLIVAPWSALAWRVPARAAVRAATVRVARGAPIDRDALVLQLVSAGYSRQSVVEERGEVAVRGGIVDVFPPQRAHPVRIELLGDEVESLRDFDPASQRSQAELPFFVAPPPREILTTRELVIERSEEIRARGLAQGVPGRTVDALLDTLLRGSLPSGSEALAALLQPALETFLDFLPEGALVVLDEPDSGRERLARFQVEALEGFAGASTGERVVCEPEELLLTADALGAAIDSPAPSRWSASKRAALDRRRSCTRPRTRSSRTACARREAATPRCARWCARSRAGGPRASPSRSPRRVCRARSGCARCSASTRSRRSWRAPQRSSGSGAHPAR